MAQVMVRQTTPIAAEARVTEWSRGEYAVIAGWGFFVLGLLKSLWSVVSWICTPQKPGSEGKAEASTVREARETICSQCGKANEEKDRGRCSSPVREEAKRRQCSTTPERNQGMRVTQMQVSPGRSPEAQVARTQILEAMVQRAQPVAQDLRDMHRLGGVGPGPMLRRGSRIP